MLNKMNGSELFFHFNLLKCCSAFSISIKVLWKNDGYQISGILHEKIGMDANKIMKLNGK